MEKRLSWLIFGAGAIGTYIGGSLILRGQNVAFIEQAPSVTEILERGLKLNLAGQEHRILHPELFTSLPDAISDRVYDVAIFAMKSYDTQAALGTIRPYAEYLPPILCLQNGVENELAIEEALGRGKVIAGTVTSSILRRAAGDILLERSRGMGIAEGHVLSHSIAQAMSEARLNPRLYVSAPAMKWSKMLTNLMANASSAILDLTPSEILSNPGLYEIEIAQLREALQVCKANQVKIVDLPDTPVRGFAWIINNLPAWSSRALISRIGGKGRGGKMPSFHMDLHSGRGKSEVDYLNGAVVRYGKQLGIPTPVNNWLNITLQQLTSGDLPQETYSHQPDNYAAAVHQAVTNSKNTP